MVIVVELSAAVQFRDNDLRNWFGRLHNAYTELVCNPFYVAGEQITSKFVFNTSKWNIIRYEIHSVLKNNQNPCGSRS